MELNFASGNNFQLIFPKLPTEDNVDRKLVLNIFDTVIPGISFAENKMNWQGWVVSGLSNLTFDNWETNFLIDEKFDNWKKLCTWMFNINNNRNRGGEIPWRFSAINTSLNIYDNYEQHILKITFNNILPQSLGKVKLSYREGESYLHSNMNFIYDYFTFE